MNSSISNAKGFCYISSIGGKEIGKINVVCEGFIISEIHEAYTFFWGSFIKMCRLTNKKTGLCYTFR